jgi:hypothetical protein
MCSTACLPTHLSTKAMKWRILPSSGTVIPANWVLTHNEPWQYVPGMSYARHCKMIVLVHFVSRTVSSTQAGTQAGLKHLLHISALMTTDTSHPFSYPAFNGHDSCAPLEVAGKATKCMIPPHMHVDVDCRVFHKKKWSSNIMISTNILVLQLQTMPFLPRRSLRFNIVRRSSHIISAPHE